MATRICPSCRSQYVASVRRCIDCDVTLVEEVAGSGESGDSSTASPVGVGDQIAYELSAWGSQLKVSLEGMLDNAGIRRVWEAGALVVPASDEAAVDALVAEVEGSEVDDLPDGAVQIAFEIEGVTAEELTDLDAELLAAQISHAWDDQGALLVGESDEEAVAAMIDEVLRADAGENNDGLALMDRLTALYVVVDKLAKDPFDQRQLGRFHAAASALDGLGAPYGIAHESWEELLAQVSATGDRLDHGWTGPKSEEDEPEPAETDPDDQGEPQEPLSVEDRARQAVRDLRSRLQELV